MNNSRRGSAGSAIFGLLVLAVVAGVVIFALKQCGSATQQYGQALSQSKQKGDRTAIMLSLRSVGQHIIAVGLSDPRSLPDDPAALADLMIDEGIASPDQIANWPSPTPQDPPFFYVPGSADSMSTRQVIVYEHPDNHDGLGGHVVYAGGSVEWLDNPAFADAIADFPR
ncbi:MAG: hypothetical protein AAFX05_13410 [Planctomycetota bacterium]